MEIAYIVYLFALVLTIVIAASMCSFLWLRRHLDGAMPALFMMVAIIQATLCFLGMTLVSDPVLAYAFARFRYLGIQLAVAFSFLFILGYTGRRDLIHPLLIVGLLSVPILAQIILWSEFAQPLYFVSWQRVPSAFIWLENAQFGPFQSVAVSYNYIISSLSLVRLIHSAISHRNIRIRKQSITLIFGIALTLLISGYSTFVRNGPIINLTPIAIGFFGIIISLLIFNVGLLESLPIPYAAAFQGMRDPALILSADNHIMQFNRSAEALLGKTGINMLQEPMDMFLPGWKEVSNGETITLQQANIKKSFRVHINSFEFASAKGNFVSLHDTTAQKGLEFQLLLRDQTLKSATVGLIITDMSLPDAPIVYVNDKFTELTGYSQAEAIGRNCRFLQSSDSRQPGLKILREAIRGGKSCQVELRNYRKSGTLFWNELRIEPIYNAQGKVTHFVGYQTDITERKEAEKQLQESESRYRSIIAAIHDGIILLDARGVIIEANEAAEHILGLTRGQLLRHSYINEYWRAVHEDGTHYPSETHPAMVALRTGTPQRDILMGVYKSSGELIWLLINSEPLFHAGSISPYAVVTTLTDITDLRRAQEKVIQSEQLFRLAFEESPMGVTITDLNGSPQRVNNSLLKMYGLSREEATEENLARAYQADDIAMIREKVQAMREGRLQRFDSELRFIRSNGTTGWRTGSAVIVPDISGRPAYILTLSFDTTIRKQAEERQAELLAQVNAANRELQDFAHIVSHDLKAPLRAIHTLAGWVLDDYGTQIPPEAQEMLITIRSRVIRLNKFIQGLLEFSKAGHAEETVIELDPSDIITEVVDLLMPPPHIHIEVATNLPKICIAPIFLRQIFQNLIGNAIKFNDKIVGKIFIGAEADGAFWRFHVTDNGIGIEEKYFDKIFQIFQILNARDDQENTGVGLSIVRKIVESQGGQIWLSSALGKGTTFYFTLPNIQLLKSDGWTHG